MKLVFATNNMHKLKEVRSKLNKRFEILSLSDINCNDEIPENQMTLEGNASEKAKYLYEKYGMDCFADDTGLEVKALNNDPGVMSARYAGPERNTLKNNEKLLSELAKQKDRSARFRTVISLILNGEEFLFEGIVEGNIITDYKGTQGFGYDPLFIPKGYTETFAEMNMESKNKISHRALAVEKLTHFLSKKSLFRG